MANLLVRDLPDDVHRALQQRAKSHGQSLQQYLAGELTRIAKRPSLAEVLDRIDQRSGGEVGLARAAKDLAEERGRRPWAAAVDAPGRGRAIDAAAPPRDIPGGGDPDRDEP